MQSNFFSRIIADGLLELTFDKQVEKAPLGQYCVGFKKVTDESGGITREPNFEFCIQDEVFLF